MDLTSFSERIHQNDLIKDALLRDIQEHCKRQRGAQSEEFARAFRRLINEHSVNIYPPRTTLRSEGMLRLGRDFALDCIDGEISPFTADEKNMTANRISQSLFEGSARVNLGTPDLWPHPTATDVHPSAVSRPSWIDPRLRILCLRLSSRRHFHRLSVPFPTSFSHSGLIFFSPKVTTTRLGISDTIPELSLVRL